MPVSSHSPGAASPSSRAAQSSRSDLGLLGDLKGVIHLDAEVPHRRLQLRVPEQQLHCAQVLCTPVDERGLCSAHRVRAVLCAIETKLLDPVSKNSGVLAGAKVW